jgi:Eukaryotic cytochrome b561
MMLTAAGTIASFILVVLHKTPPHFEDLHQIFGLIIMLGVCLQVILGFVINKLYVHERSSIPWYDKLHWWVGYLNLTQSLAIPAWTR